MSQQRHPDYTDEDLDILASGSWQLETGDEQAPVQPVARQPETGAAEPAGDTARPVEATGQVSRVELQPGGVKAAIEAILAVADVPVSEREFSAALVVSERAVEAALDELYREYRGEGQAAGEPRGFELRRINGGWRLYARQSFSPWVGRFVVGSQGTKLSRATLETLAIIAYQQPVTRAYVAQVRGVSVDAAFRTLKTRGLITETVPDERGKPQYITTASLLEELGLNSLADLPDLAPYLPDVGEVGQDPQLSDS